MYKFSSIFLMLYLITVCLLLVSCISDKSTNVMNVPPAIPGNPIPNNQQNYVYLPVHLSWNCSDADNDSITYDIYLGTENPPQLYSSNVHHKYVDADTLSYNRTYYWKILAKDSNDNSSTSPVWSFRTATPISEPTNPNPANYAQGVDLTPLLQWTCQNPYNDNLTYDVYFGTDYEPTNRIAHGLEQTQLQCPQLTINTYYFWKVVAYGNDNNPVASQLWEFSTYNHAPKVPFNPSPAMNQTDIQCNVTLRWESTDEDNDSLYYDLYFGTNSNQLNLIAQNTTTNAYTKTGLARGTNYYWKVVVSDHINQPVTSPIWRFTTVTNWEIRPSGTTSFLRKVFFINQFKGWVVGYDGVILHTTDGGETWSPQNSGVTVGLNEVTFIDESNGWVVGDFDYVLHTNDGGATWIHQTVPWPPGYEVFGTFNAISFLDTNHGWIAGYGGVLFETTNGGDSWVWRESLWERISYVNTMKFVSSNCGWVGGSWKLYATTDGGATWNRQNESSNSYQGFAFINETTGWVVGRDYNGYVGLILKTVDSGNNWTPQTSTTASEMMDIEFPTPLIGWAVKNNNDGHLSGAIVHTTNGGNTWNQQPYGVTYALAGVCFVDATHGWAVGEDGIILKYFSQ